MYHELTIPGGVVPKARPRFNSKTGRAYTDPRYRAWLDMASETVAWTLRKPMMDGPVIVRLAFAPTGVDVAVMDASPVSYAGRRGDVDNMAGSCLDALQFGGAITNDHNVVRLEAW